MTYVPAHYRQEQLPLSVPTIADDLLSLEGLALAKRLEELGMITETQLRQWHTEWHSEIVDGDRRWFIPFQQFVTNHRQDFIDAVAISEGGGGGSYAEALRSLIAPSTHEQITREGRALAADLLRTAPTTDYSGKTH